MGNIESAPKPFPYGTCRVKITGGSRVALNPLEVNMFKPGDIITGTASLDLRENYPAYNLTVGLFGYKEVHFYHDPGSDRNVKVYGWDQLYCVRSVL